MPRSWMSNEKERLLVGLASEGISSSRAAGAGQPVAPWVEQIGRWSRARWGAKSRGQGRGRAAGVCRMTIVNMQPCGAKWLHDKSSGHFCVPDFSDSVWAAVKSRLTA